MISIYSSSQALTDVIKKELEDKSVLVAYNIDNFISERIIDAKLLSQADVLEGGIIPDIIQYLTEIVEENKWINDIDIIDLSGKIIASSGEQNEKGQLFVDAHPGANALYLATSKARQGEVYISEAQFLDTGPGILLMTPVTDDSNRLIVGVLTLEVNLRNIERITSLFDEGIVGDKHVYIVDKDGKVIVTKDPSVDVFNTFPDLLVHPKLLSAFSRQGDMGNIIYTDIAGDEVMAGYSDMGEFGVNNALDWSIIAIAPLDEMNAPVRMMQNWLFTTGIIIAFIAMVIIYLFINNTKIVLQKMAAQADKISLGDFSQQLPFKTQDKGALATFVIAFNRMVSNTRETMEALRGREQDLAITLDSIGDAVITTDAKGYINRMNPVAEQLTGWSMQEAKKQPLQSIFPVIDATTREITENPVEQVLATGETVYLSNHTTLIARNGTEYQIAYSAAPIRNSDDSITGIVLVFNDVTEQYHLHKKAQLAQQQLLGLFDGMQTMVGVLECDGTVIFVNNTPLIAAGIELDDVRNKKAWDCPWFNYDPKIQDLIKSDVAEANAGTNA
ncbi:MAG: cache domain-containing protein [Gammaproteobacteria bacterium]